MTGGLIRVLSDGTLDKNHTGRVLALLGSLGECCCFVVVVVAGTDVFTTMTPDGRRDLSSKRLD